MYISIQTVMCSLSLTHRQRHSQLHLQYIADHMIMARQPHGFDCEFVSSPPRSVPSRCQKCTYILRKPFQVTCCGKVFCQACINGRQPCPSCSAEMYNAFHDKRLQERLYKLNVKCTNRKKGCKWIGKLENLNDHLNSKPLNSREFEGCPFTKIKCQYCFKFFHHCDIQVHQSEKCSKRPFTCEYCKQFDACYETVVTDHWPVCGSCPVQCPKKCGALVPRNKLQSHTTGACLMVVIDCEFKHVGCNVRRLRKDMPAHLRDSIVAHVSLQAACYSNTISELQAENKQLKQQVAKLTSDLQALQVSTPFCPVEFTLTDFEEHKRVDDSWWSPPFYTHPNGLQDVFES